MPKGVATNRNPSPDTRFGGKRGNIPGRTGLQREMEIRNAQIATEIRARLLDGLKASLQEDTSTANALARIEANVLKLLKDSEERGLGTPQASVDVTTNGKDIKGGIDLSSLSTETLAELMAARDAAKPD